jgi:membrane associated rhomboid family serine protease
LIPIGDGHRTPIFPLAVYGIVLANVAVFLAEIEAPRPDTLINAFALIPYDVSHHIQLAPPSPPSPYATLISSQFLHSGLLHIFFNMLFLLVFGPDIEYALGHVRFVAFYLVCGVLGGLAQISIDPGSHVPSIGASGAIAGVLGAYIIRYPTNSVETIVPIGCFPLFLRVPAALVIGLWAASQFLHGFGAVSTRVLSEQGGGVAYFAHIGGFLAGVILIDLFRDRTRGLRRRYRYYY